MRLDADSDGTIVLKEVFNSVVLETAEGNRIAICMRDDGFEIGVGDLINKDDYTWYSAGNGVIEKLGKQVVDKVEARKWNYGCDPDFMAALKRGDHMRGIGLTEEQIQKVLKITRQFPFKGEQDDRENLPET